MEWNIGTYDPVADFGYSQVSGSQYQFSENSSNATDFLWDFGDGNTSTQPNPQHTYAASGNYTIELTASKCGLANSTQQSLQIGSIGLSEQTLKDFSVYPNPTASYLHIDWNVKRMSIIEVEILDISGKVIYSQTLQSAGKGFQLDVSHLEEGVYFLHLNTDEMHRFVRIN
jgi:hypothetical protein